MASIFKKKNLIAIVGLIFLCFSANGQNWSQIFPVTSSIYDSKPEDFSGPITITSGGKYRGNWQSLDPTKAAITINTSEPVIIENSSLRSRSNIIKVARGIAANLTIKNTNGYG